MEIKNFFQKIFSHHKEIHVPPIVLSRFQEQFSDSMNAEWLKNDVFFEVVFYRDDRENIATYQKDGSLLSLKINLVLEELPDKIRQRGQEHGELMNAILIESQGIQIYELIVRDAELVRYTLLLNESGETQGKEKL